MSIRDSTDTTKGDSSGKQPTRPVATGTYSEERRDHGRVGSIYAANYHPRFGYMRVAEDYAVALVYLQSFTMVGSLQCLTFQQVTLI